MLEGISERVEQQLSEGAFTTGSRPGTAERARESGISTRSLPAENDLLSAVIILGIIVFVLIVIIIYGYCKYVRGGRTKKMEEGSSVDDRATADVEKSPPPLDLQPVSTLADIPVKTRKRSMTFSETDEECRKYREDLADSYTGATETVSSSSTVGEQRSRKKSVVTFAGVEEIDFHPVIAVCTRDNSRRFVALS